LVEDKKYLGEILALRVKVKALKNRDWIEVLYIIKINYTWQLLFCYCIMIIER
jgi:hypothetical protein